MRVPPAFCIVEKAAGTHEDNVHLIIRKDLALFLPFLHSILTHALYNHLSGHHVQGEKRQQQDLNDSFHLQLPDKVLVWTVVALMPLTRGHGRQPLSQFSGDSEVRHDELQGRNSTAKFESPSQNPIVPDALKVVSLQ